MNQRASIPPPTRTFMTHTELAHTGPRESQVRKVRMGKRAPPGRGSGNTATNRVLMSLKWKAGPGPAWSLQGFLVFSGLRWSRDQGVPDCLASLGLASAGDGPHIRSPSPVHRCCVLSHLPAPPRVPSASNATPVHIHAKHMHTCKHILLT